MRPGPVDLGSGRQVGPVEQLGKLLKSQIQLLHVLIILQGLSLFAGVVILIYWVWK